MSAPTNTDTANEVAAGHAMSVDEAAEEACDPD